MTIHVKTNWHRRQLLDRSELTAYEIKQLGLEDDDHDSLFFRYLGSVYALSEFTVHSRTSNSELPKHVQAYATQSYFSAVGITFADINMEVNERALGNPEYVIVTFMYW